MNIVTGSYNHQGYLGEWVMSGGIPQERVNYDLYEYGLKIKLTVKDLTGTDIEYHHILLMILNEYWHLTHQKLGYFEQFMKL